jgi:RES domain-containing protein
MTELELKLHQRMLKVLNLASSFQGLVGFRNVGQPYANSHDALSTKGSFEYGGRYNVAKDFGVLYLSCDLHTCVGELERAARREGVEVAEKLPRTVMGIKVKLTKVLDLTDARVLRRLGLSRKILSTDWVKENNEGRDAPTQVIGRAAKNIGFEALLVPSESWHGMNLNLLDDGNLVDRVLVVNCALLGPRKRARRLHT